METRGLYSAQTIAVFVNAPNRRSIEYNTEFFVFDAYDKDYSSYALVHETGHVLGLSDGYYTWYDHSKIAGGENTELFTDQSTFSGIRKQMADRKLIFSISTPYTCFGQPVYTAFGESDSIMVRRYSDAQMLSDSISPSIFTSLQVAIMKQRLQILKQP